MTAAVGSSLQAQADALQRTLNETIRTSAQIIDANEIGPVSRTPEGIAQMYARFPQEKVDAFLRRVHCIERIRQAVLGQISRGDTSNVILYLIGQFGYGACGEMAMHAYLLGAAYAHTMFVGCKGSNGPFEESHAFAVFHTDKEQLDGCYQRQAQHKQAPSLSALLDDLPPGSVIVDPFFRFAAELPQDKEKLAPLRTYLTNRRITWVTDLYCLQKGSEKCAAVLARAQELYPKIQAAGALKELSLLFPGPGIEWKQNKKGEVKIFATVSSQQAAVIKKRLEQAGIAVSLSRIRGKEAEDERVVMLVNPPLGALCSLTAPSLGPARPAQSP